MEVEIFHKFIITVRYISADHLVCFLNFLLPSVSPKIKTVFIESELYILSSEFSNLLIAFCMQIPIAVNTVSRLLMLDSKSV